MIVSAQIDRQ